MKLHGENQYWRVGQMGTVSGDPRISTLSFVCRQRGEGAPPEKELELCSSCSSLLPFPATTDLFTLCPPYTGHPRCEQPPARLGLSSLWCLGAAPGSPGPPGRSADQRQQHRTPLSRRTLPGAAVMAIPSALQFTRHCYLYSALMPRLKSLTVG